MQLSLNISGKKENDLPRTQQTFQWPEWSENQKHAMGPRNAYF